MIRKLLEFAYNKSDDILIDLRLNIAKLNDTFRDCMDFSGRNIYLRDNTEGYLLYIKGLVDAAAVQRDFITPILDLEFSDFLDKTRVCKLPTINLLIFKDFKAIIQAILSGKTIILLNGLNYALGCSLIQFDKRSIHEPEVEKGTRGPHEGFIEVLETNISILRRRIKSTRFKLKEYTLGETTNQKVVLGYIEGRG